MGYGGMEIPYEKLGGNPIVKFIKGLKDLVKQASDGVFSPLGKQNAYNSLYTHYR